MATTTRLYDGTIHVKEINGKHGDLVDLEFRCNECFERRLLPGNAGYLYWYADYREAIPSDFSTDYPTYCKGCDRELIDVEGHC